MIIVITIIIMVMIIVFQNNVCQYVCFTYAKIYIFCTPNKNNIYIYIYTFVYAKMLFVYIKYYLLYAKLYICAGGAGRFLLNCCLSIFFINIANYEILFMKVYLLNCSKAEQDGNITTSNNMYNLIQIYKQYNLNIY